MSRRVIRPTSARSEGQFIVLRDAGGRATFVQMPSKIGAFVWSVALNMELRMAKRKEAF